MYLLQVTFWTPYQYLYDLYSQLTLWFFILWEITFLQPTFWFIAFCQIHFLDSWPFANLPSGLLTFCHLTIITSIVHHHHFNRSFMSFICYEFGQMSVHSNGCHLFYALDFWSIKRILLFFKDDVGFFELSKHHFSIRILGMSL